MNANVLAVGETGYEDSGEGAAAGPAEGPEPGQPVRAMLRLELRGAADDAARAALRARTGDAPDPGGPRPAVAAEPSQSFAVLADRLTVESGRLSLRHADEVVFRCPVSALISIAFELLDDPRPVPRLGLPPARPHAAHAAAEPEGARREAHQDLASANTRWTSADERRLVELHAAGVPIDTLARTIGRREGAIRARLFKLRHAQQIRSSTPNDPASAAPPEDSAAGSTG
jgi:hypothetical protein